MKELIAITGEKIKVDDKDFETLSKYTWKISKQGKFANDGNEGFIPG
jgi:hypothetical protein